MDQQLCVHNRRKQTKIERRLYMTITMNTSANDRKRPSLSEQINRLDKTLDGLADGLNEAVADAVKDAVGIAVREAVQAVIKEVLVNPDVIAKLHHAMASSASANEPAKAIPSRPTLRERLNRLLAG